MNEIFIFKSYKSIKQSKSILPNLWIWKLKSFLGLFLKLHKF